MASVDELILQMVRGFVAILLNKINDHSVHNKAEKHRWILIATVILYAWSYHMGVKDLLSKEKYVFFCSL